MRAYKCNLKINELNRLKDEFFTSRLAKEGPIWKQIREACVYHLEKSKEMLEALNLTPMNNCMNLLYDNEKNRYYAIPNFCINDPYLQKTILQATDERTAANIEVIAYNITY